ncbi:MAG: sulfite exporter TauE/SafE family protein [Deltaproteobacteria bacterium]|nr:sulfite exporter TauE/SafE family protein [Deltaproteobacteria bacterium]MBW2359986.1 sulfite exporter TauE/SafE family protein [Deltaproteobacteria bacterium]
MAVACTVQGSLGFGSALLAAPLLALIHPAFVPGPILAANVLLTLLVARREWSAIDFAGLKFIIVGRVVGNAVAAAMLIQLSQVFFDGLFGALVLAAVGLSFARPSAGRSPRVLAAAGFASGIMGTLSSIGGPPVALVYPHDDPARFRATLSAHFIFGGSLSLFAVWIVGRYGATELALTGLLLPAALAGFWLSRFGIQRIGTARLRSAVLALSTMAGVGVLLRAISTHGS